MQVIFLLFYYEYFDPKLTYLIILYQNGTK